MSKKDKKISEDMWLWGWIVILSVVLSISLLLFAGLGLVETLRMVYGSIYVLFLPGYVITSLFFSSDEIDILEKIALSFGLSIAIVPLVTFYLNFLFGLRITALNVALTILGIIAVSYLLKSQEMRFVRVGKSVDNFIDKKIIKRSKLLSRIFKE